MLAVRTAFKGSTDSAPWAMIFDCDGVILEVLHESSTLTLPWFYYYRPEPIYHLATFFIWTRTARMLRCYLKKNLNAPRRPSELKGLNPSKPSEHLHPEERRV